MFKSKENISKQPVKNHPWRLCPNGFHWVREHKRETKNGSIGVVSSHCAKNPSSKDHLYSDEIKKMMELNSNKIKLLPCPDNLGLKQWRKNYDLYTAFWSKYWNDVFKFKEPIDANLIKALIATESDFNPKAKVKASTRNFARGLMQVTDQSQRILKNSKGELKDHFISVTREGLFNPSINICAGIRWFVQKKKLLSSKLKREATWYEAVAEYKSYDQDWDKNPEQKEKFDHYLQLLNKCDQNK